MSDLADEFELKGEEWLEEAIAADPSQHRIGAAIIGIGFLLLSGLQQLKRIRTDVAAMRSIS